MSSRKNRAAPRLLCSVMQSPFVAEFVAELGVESAGDVDGQPPRRQRKAPQVAARTAPTWSHSLAAFAALRSIARRNPDPDGTPPPDSPARCPATPAGNRSTSRPLSLSLGRLRTVAPQGAVGPSGARTFGTVAGCRYAMSVVGETTGDAHRPAGLLPVPRRVRCKPTPSAAEGGSRHGKSGSSQEA